jgi:hypothetical protein
MTPLKKSELPAETELRAFESWMSKHMTADWRNPENCYSWKDLLKCWMAARKK